HPELKCCQVDLDPKSNVAEIIPGLVDELFSNNNENQVAIRDGSRYVARLVRQQKQKLSADQKLPILENQPVELKLSEYGLIENLDWKVMQRRPPQGNEVEIQVKAVGLNFRDVLNSLGLLKEYYAEVLGITNVSQLTLGFECVGVIASVGENVSQWQVGDEVMALVYNGFSSFVTTPATSVLAKPKDMSFTEAATLPLTFATACYGLQHLAKIKPGDRVLIHSAAGGVGQAAVQIALQAGAEVFATASPPKWEFLKSAGVKNIMNSRNLDFADEIMKLTSGKGVDIVFNSLNGEHIDKSFDVLATEGRFVEIGKIGIWDRQKVMQKRPDANYFPFDIGEEIQQQPDLVGQISDELNRQYEEGKLKELSYKVFPSTEIKDAFRYMQQGKHIGKVVITMPETGDEPKSSETGDEPKSIKPEASYLITGGLGNLGLEVAQWMVKGGAKHIVLTGRRNPNETVQKIIEEIEEAGASVTVLLGDISSQESLSKILEEISASLPPLKGVIHAAGVLEDGLLRNLSWQQFTKVMSPKVTGTWYLHEMTKDLSLDFFVCFSSMAAMIGNGGQGNYAAANAFMDALAHYRRGLGMSGLSINWSTWAGGGMAASLDSSQQKQLEKSGLTAIKPEQGMQALELLLPGSSSQVGVLPVNWSEFFRQTPTAEKIPLLSGFVSSKPAASTIQKKSSFIEELEAKAISERMELLTTHIRSMLAKTLGLEDAQKIGMREPLFDLGLDSLMAVELKNRLESSLNVTLSSTLLFDYPVLEKLVKHLADDVIPVKFSEETDEKDETENVEWETDDSSTDDSEDDPTRYQEMSEDDVMDLLAKKLESLGG
ncbi:MAG: SDR family NAD(P)-dependent oxidoreductase, partial [Okeania sp. SIO2F4]|uniref:type I polyketide synthase n=1 Tax=Okeania sp. SIO2F4 TaxID=2607790 RepID=UPI00142A8A0C